jgi:hypothetical protein
MNIGKKDFLHRGTSFVRPPISINYKNGLLSYGHTFSLWNMDGFLVQIQYFLFCYQFIQMINIFCLDPNLLALYTSKPVPALDRSKAGNIPQQSSILQAFQCCSCSCCCVFRFETKMLFSTFGKMRNHANMGEFSRNFLMRNFRELFRFSRKLNPQKI